VEARTDKPEEEDSRQAMELDSRSKKNIATLHPALQGLATKLIELALAQGINAKVISGLRTYAEQNALYAQGRTQPGLIVTKAKGGQSWHNFGTAFDVGIFSADSQIYYGESPAYKTLGKIGESLGLEWGGSWKGFVDEPHFQLKLGLSKSELHRRKMEGLDVVSGEPAVSHN
jgi:peptidoglycan L-alanyl-D-glutamate endopeptidase CwlK